MIHEVLTTPPRVARMQAELFFYNELNGLLDMRLEEMSEALTSDLVDELRDMARNIGGKKGMAMNRAIDELLEAKRIMDETGDYWLAGDHTANVRNMKTFGEFRGDEKP
jgi:hypothetical protein